MEQENRQPEGAEVTAAAATAAETAHADAAPEGEVPAVVPPPEAKAAPTPLETRDFRSGFQPSRSQRESLSEPSLRLPPAISFGHSVALGSNSDGHRRLK